MPAQSHQEGSQTLPFCCLLGIGWVAGTGDNRLSLRHRITVNQLLYEQISPFFLLPKPGFANMESLEGTEDTPGKPQIVVGYCNIRPSLCPREPKAYPAFSSFLGLSAHTISISEAAD